MSITMITLIPEECRVLGVLIEKAQTTPGQYPLTLNALVNGANQKSNRYPLVSMNDDQAQRALDTLRAKGLVREVLMSGSRVAKYRHVAREALEVSTAQLVLLAELLLRGPQSSGELRGRATRMHPLESTEIVENLLVHLMERPEPMVVKILPPAGSRAHRYVQQLCPKLHALAQSAKGPAPVEPAGAAYASPEAAGMDAVDVAKRLNQLESEVAQLRRGLRSLTEALGEPDPCAVNHSGISPGK